MASLSYTASWNVFRSHTIVLEDDAMRDQINCLINSVTDPFSSEIRYHQRCWLKYVGAYQKMSVEQKLPLLHEVTLREAQTMFLDHACQVIFDDHEIRTLQGLLRDYKSIVGTYGLPTIGGQVELCEGDVNARVWCWHRLLCFSSEKSE